MKPRKVVDNIKEFSSDNVECSTRLATLERVVVKNYDRMVISEGNFWSLTAADVGREQKMEREARLDLKFVKTMKNEDYEYGRLLKPDVTNSSLFKIRMCRVSMKNVRLLLKNWFQNLFLVLRRFCCGMLHS